MGGGWSLDGWGGGWSLDGWGGGVEFGWMGGVEFGWMGGLSLDGWGGGVWMDGGVEFGWMGGGVWMDGGWSLDGWGWSLDGWVLIFCCVLFLSAKTGGRGSSESNSYTSDSYSSSGGSSYSRSRSRSRSPYHRGGGVSSHHVRRHKHERRHEKREKKAKGHEGSRERGRVKGHKESKKEKKRSKHRHSKKKSHESPTRSPDRDTRHHHATSLSPEKKLGIEELAEVANDDAPTTASNTPLSGEGLLANTSLLPPAEVGGVACEEGGTQQELSEGGGAEHLGRSEFSMPAGGGASEVSVLPTKETNGDTTDSTPVAEGVSEGAWSVLGAAETEAAGDSVGGVSTSPNEGTTTGGAQGDEMLEDAVEISINAEEVGELDSTLLGDMPPGTKSPQETKEKGKKEEEEEEESSHYKAKDKDTHPGMCVCVGGG